MLPQYGTVAAIAACIAHQAIHGGGAKRRTALWFASLFAAVFCFGYAVEWRVWLVFVPYVILTVAISNSRLATLDAVATAI